MLCIDVFERPLILTLLGPSSLLYGEDSAIPGRFVVKLYDPVTSLDAEAAINTREYTLLLRDLQNKFGLDLTVHYMPISYQWWIQNLRHVVVVKMKTSKKLHVVISKRKIEENIQKCMKSEKLQIYDDSSVFMDGKFEGSYEYDTANDGIVAVVPADLEFQERPPSQPGKDRPRNKMSPASRAVRRHTSSLGKHNTRLYDTQPIAFKMYVYQGIVRTRLQVHLIRIKKAAVGLFLQWLRRNV